MKTREIDLNIDSGYAGPVINVSQYDHDTGTLIFHLYDGIDEFNIPDGAMVLITGSKPDKEVFVYNVDSYSGNQVVSSLYDQMTSASGDVTCELRIYQGGNAVGTANFTLHVEKAAASDDSVTSESAYNGLNAVIEALTTIDKDVASAKASEDAASNYANIAKSWAVGPSNGNMAGTDSNNAMLYADLAESYTEQMKVSLGNLSNSVANAKTSADNAAASAKAAADSQTAAANSESAASESEKNVSTMDAEVKEALSSVKSLLTSTQEAQAAAEKAAESASADAVTAAEYARAAEYSFGIDPTTGLFALFKMTTDKTATTT